MWGIIKNDIFVNRKSIIFRIIIMLLASVVFVIPFSETMMEDMVVRMILNCLCFVLALGIFICLGGLVSALIQEDEKTEWKAYVSTTKAGDKGRITEKYIMSVLTFVVALLYILLINIAAEKINGIAIDEWLIMGVFFFFIIQSAVELPFMLRFGSKYGMLVKQCVLFALIFGVIVYFLYGPIPSFLSDQDKVVEWVLKIFGGTATSQLHRAVEIEMAAGVGLYIVSYLVAIVFRKRA